MVSRVLRVGLRLVMGELARIPLVLGIFSCLLPVSIPFATFGSEPDNEVLLSAVEEGREAIRQWNYPAMTNAAQHLEEMDVEAGDDSFWRDYWAGTLYFHAVLFLNEAGERSKSAGLKSSAMASLRKALQARPERSDAHAMMGTLYGIHIQARPATALWNGPKLMSHMKKALAYGDGNPQVSYLMGVSTLKRAGTNSREIDRANEFFMQALEAYKLQQNQTRSPWEATWGHDHTLLFLGRAAEQKGDAAAAASWYDQAVAMNPHLTRTEEGVE